MRPRPAVLLTRNPTKDFYPERPSGVKDLSSSHMSIPICHSPPSLALTKNTAPFVFKRLRSQSTFLQPLPRTQLPLFSSGYALFQVPYPVSPVVAALTKTAGCVSNNSHSGTLTCPPANRPLDYFAGAAGFFLSVHSALSVVSALNPSFPFFRLSTFNFGLSTSVSLGPIPFLFKSLRTLLRSAKTQLLCFHAIPDSLHETPGGGVGPLLTIPQLVVSCG